MAAAYARQDVVGEFLTTEDGTSIPIIGVAPPGFEGLLSARVGVWVMNPPLALATPSIADGLDADAKRRIARLWSFVTVSTAR